MYIRTKDGKRISSKQLKILGYRNINELKIKTMTYKECSDTIEDVSRELKEMNGEENHYINYDEFDVE